MFSRKRLLLVLLPLLALGAAACYWVLTPSAKVEVDPAQIWEPKLPVTGPGFTITPETTGVLWQRPVRDAKGKLVELRVAYRDGRLGVYKFDKNELVDTFTCYAGETSTQVLFEAWFGPDQQMQRSRKVRNDGTTEWEFRRQPDGTEIRESYGPNGREVNKTVTTFPDGSQRTATREADGKVTVTEVKAEFSETSIGERLRQDDGIYTPILKLKYMGVKVAEWEYYDLNGRLRHKGTVNKDGSVEVTLINDEGKPLMKQTWQKSGEDWNRAFYRVSAVEVYNAQGQVTARAKVNPDGVTPSEICSYGWDGKLQRKDVFNSRGVPLRSEFYYSYYGPYTDIPSNIQEAPAGSPPVALPPRIVGEPAGMDPKARLYRMLGTPFADGYDDSLKLPVLFIAP